MTIWQGIVATLMLWAVCGITAFWLTLRTLSPQRISSQRWGREVSRVHFDGRRWWLHSDAGEGNWHKADGIFWLATLLGPISLALELVTHVSALLCQRATLVDRGITKLNGGTP